MNMFNTKVSSLISKLEGQQDAIPSERKEALKLLSDKVKEMLEELGSAQFTIICTHNSRRSQLGQLWIKVAAMHYGIDNVYTFSGGTESTAFNHRMVDAIARAGFDIDSISGGDNPKYKIDFGANDPSLDILYSKKFDESYNPQKNYIAIMVCDSANEACPFVPGCWARFPMMYSDPKAFDGTDLEASKYSERLEEIGRDMLYMMSLLG